ncbi:MAG TPA: MMPL family transporter [Nordella sp.]|nr:MMPL family transporter [Nordella sp.]
MTWQDRQSEPAERQRPRLRPNIFARLARFCFRHGLIIIAAWVALAIPALVFAVTAMQIQMQDQVLVTADTVIGAEQSRLAAEFPEPSESIVAVIDSKDPQLARSGAERVAARMAEQTNVFRNVFAPGTGRFFDDDGVLYLNEQGVSDMVARIQRSAPLFQALSISPNLTGLAVLADQVAKVAAEGRSPEVVTALFTEAAKTVQAQIAGQRRDLDWLSLIEHGVTIESPRWYVLSYPVADGDVDPARHAVEEARRLADLIETEFGGRISVALTGRPVLRAMKPPLDIRVLLLPTLLSGIVLLVILAFGLTRFGLVVIVLLMAAITFVITTALALAALGAFDRVSLAYPVLFSGLIGVTTICLILRAQEAEQGGCGRLAAAMLTAQAMGLPLLIWLIGISATGLALIGSPFLALQKLAVILAIMSTVIFLAAVTLLPAFLSLLRPRFLDDEDEEERVHWLDNVMTRPTSYGWWALRRGLAATLIAVAVLCALLVPALRFESPVAVARDGASPPEKLFRDLSTQEPSLVASGQILAEPGDPARQLVRRLATLPEVAGVRWVETFLPPGEADKRAILAKLQGAFPRNTTAVADIPDDLLRAEFVKLQDGLQRIAAEPRATPELAQAANELRRSLVLLDGTGVAAPQALRQLERTFFVRLQLLLDRIDRLSRLDPLTVDRLDPAIHRQYVSRSGLWRIEVQPRHPDDIEAFAAALRSVTPSAAGAALIEADRLAIMRAAMPSYIGVWALLAIFLPLVLFLNLRKAMRILLPVATASLLGFGVTAMMGIHLYPESITVFMLLVCFTQGAAILAESWYGARPNGQWPQVSSRPRALLLAAFVVLAAFAPLVLSPLPAVQQFGVLLLVSISLSLIGLFVLLPQLRVWTAPRRKRRDDEEEA